MRRKIFLSFLALILISCVTINIYFPSAEVEKAAREITEEVRGLKQSPEAQPTQQEETPGDQSSFWEFGVQKAFAQKELSISNATIRQLKERMKARYPKLKPYLIRGIIGESADGLLVLRSQEGLNLKERAEVKRLIEAENRDREALYYEVMKALGVAPKDLPRIRAIFAKEWQRTAPKGTWIEVSPGKWVRK